MKRVTYHDFCNRTDDFMDEVESGGVLVLTNADDRPLARLCPPTDKPEDDKQVTLLFDEYMDLFYDREHIKFLKIFLKAMIEFGQKAGLSADKAYELISQRYCQRDKEHLHRSLKEALDSGPGRPGEEAIEEIKQQLKLNARKDRRRSTPRPTTELPHRVVYPINIKDVIRELRAELGIDT